ncbi:alpha/beta hydrolase [Legionella anisa]|uniref:Alpha/beta hydrolase n=1 Tax=Legionella anisa TaxID=28082 RepID=A0AAX0WXD4_9GAMM|nr:alpha/beta hydrolase [Legionella anisa]AWN72369.1 alpha/beta hydrolase [Legionella anisa]KTC69092.1 lipolytic protein [Legionella anisa]MCW8423123.1 alpha/beta hydrolase [Legionella anisa]MCW8447789.1 alpha/beta hydrolase [Legionella anisa]PNL62820.1 alpha/beta hydrolase [Legionella anisa]
MNKDIVLIPGALATPKLWNLQEIFFQESKRFHYVDVLNSNSIVEMAHRFTSIAPKKFTLIGFSMGGYIALELYRHIPNKIEKLILINSAAKLVSEKGQLERERSLDLIDKGKFDFLIKLIFKNSIYNKQKHNLLLPIAQEMAMEVGVKNYKKQLNAILNKPDHSTLLPSIECPTLLIASKEDHVMPPERSEHMAKNIKHSTLIYFEQCGHMAMLEKPEEMNQILNDWL